MRCVSNCQLLLLSLLPRLISMRHMHFLTASHDISEMFEKLPALGGNKTAQHQWEILGTNFGKHLQKAKTKRAHVIVVVGRHVVVVEVHVRREVLRVAAFETWMLRVEKCDGVPHWAVFHLGNTCEIRVHRLQF